MKYRKKPVVVEAIQWNGDNAEEVLRFCDSSCTYETNSAILSIKTLEGVMTASRGDYIIKGVNGEFYPCKPDIFAATYESADVTATQKRTAMADEKLEIARKALQEIADTTFAMEEEDGYEATIDNMCDIASKALVKLNKPLEPLIGELTNVKT